MFSYMLKKKLYRSNKSGHGVKYFRNIFFLLKETCYADVNILMDILVEVVFSFLKFFKIKLIIMKLLKQGYSFYVQVS